MANMFNEDGTYNKTEWKAAYNTDDKDDYTNSTTNYSMENANKFVDITDIIGEYYVGIVMTGRNVRASIKEIKILR